MYLAIQLTSLTLVHQNVDKILPARSQKQLVMKRLARDIQKVLF